MKTLKRAIAVSGLLVAMAVTPTFAQERADFGGPTSNAAADDNPNYAPLLGLLGLLGLFGLKRRHDRTRNDAAMRG